MRYTETHINNMKTDDKRKLQLLLCAALIDKRDTQRRILEKINYVINKNNEQKRFEK